MQTSYNCWVYLDLEMVVGVAAEKGGAVAGAAVAVAMAAGEMDDH